MMVRVLMAPPAPSPSHRPSKTCAMGPSLSRKRERECDRAAFLPLPLAGEGGARDPIGSWEGEGPAPHTNAGGAE